MRLTELSSIIRKLESPQWEYSEKTLDIRFEVAYKGENELI